MGFRFEKLDVWRRSVAFADAIFTVADGLAERYQYALGEQLRRAALSVPINIAEGTGRERRKEQQSFFRVAKGSVYEVVSLLVMAGKRGAISRDAYRAHYREADEMASMLTVLVRKQA